MATAQPDKGFALAFTVKSADGASGQEEHGDDE